MKATIFVSILFLFLSSALSQPCEGIPNGIYEVVYWESGEPDSQKRYWEDGSLKIESERINDSLILRKEYYENGYLKLTCEMSQGWLKDTLYKKSTFTGKDTMMFVEGFRDFPNGLYTRYSKHRPGLRIYWGNLNNRKHIGVWRHFESQGFLTVANFDSTGYLVGTYNTFRTKRYKTPSYEDTLWAGQYRIHRDTITRISPKDMETEYRVVRKESRRVGTWRYYDYHGKLTQTVEYKWYDD